MRNDGSFLRMTAVVCAVAMWLPSIAWAGNAEESLALAQRGAAFFKTSQYYAAATAFERAYQIDSRDAKNLRYAGRAWQEVGHWARALMLLESYVMVEANPDLKASIENKLTALRQATPTQIAEALAVATRRFPEAHLSYEAALAFEKLGDAAALKRAAQFLEVARLTATARDKDSIDAAIRRVQARRTELEHKPAEVRMDPKIDARSEAKPADKPQVARPTPDAGSEPGIPHVEIAKPATVPASWHGWALLGSGAAVGLGGLGLYVATRPDQQALDKDLALDSAGMVTQISKEAAKERASSVNARIGTAVALGVVGLSAAAIGGWMLWHAPKRVSVLPGPGTAGVALAVRF